QEHQASTRARQDLQVVQRQLTPLFFGQTVEGGILHPDRIDRYGDLLQDFCHLNGGQTARVIDSVGKENDRPLSVPARDHSRGGRGDGIEEGRSPGGLETVEVAQQAGRVGGKVVHHADFVFRKG